MLSGKAFRVQLSKKLVTSDHNSDCFQRPASLVVWGEKRKRAAACRVSQKLWSAVSISRKARISTGRSVLAVERKLRRSVRASATQSEPAVPSTSVSSHPGSNYYLVNEGDTLTSIAKKSQTSVRLLADANNIEDIDFLLSGQRLLIPVESTTYETANSPTVDAYEFPIRRGDDFRSSRDTAAEQVDSREETDVNQLSSSGVSQQSQGQQLAASVRPAASLNIPKLAVPLLLMAPLLGFCIRCIVDALHLHKQRQEAKLQAEKDAWEMLHRPKAQRWQKILEEDRDGVEPTSLSADEPTSRNPWSGGDIWTADPTAREMTRASTRTETDEEIGLRHKEDYEDIRKSYAELESTYVKFLADSGMSKAGYWRGSGVTTARLEDVEP